MSLAKKIIGALRTVAKFTINNGVSPSQHKSYSRTPSAGGFSGLAQIQYQDISGNWRSHSFISPNDTNIRLRMKDVKQSYPNFKIRAVDSDNRVLDITQ